MERSAHVPLPPEPPPLSSSPFRACVAALQLASELGRLNGSILGSHAEPIAAGVTTGWAFAGNIGAGRAFSGPPPALMPRARVEDGHSGELGACLIPAVRRATGGEDGDSRVVVEWGRRVCEAAGD